MFLEVQSSSSKNPINSQFPMLNPSPTKTPGVFSVSRWNPNWYWSLEDSLGSLAWGHSMSPANFLVLTSNLHSSNHHIMTSSFHAFAHFIFSAWNILLFFLQTAIWMLSSPRELSLLELGGCEIFVCQVNSFFVFWLNSGPGIWKWKTAPTFRGFSVYGGR